MDENQFMEFLVMNPEVSYIWADHHQLQVTANLYNTTVQVLTVDEHGNTQNVTLHPVMTRQDSSVPDIQIMFSMLSHVSTI